MDKSSPMRKHTLLGSWHSDASSFAGLVDALVYKGAIDCSGSPNYPAADAGHTYKISVAGKIGGGSGTSVAVGDMIICSVDGTAAGTQAAVGANWNIIQTNLSNPVSVAEGGTGAATLADGGILVGAAAGPVEVVAPGALTEMLVGGGAGANPVWTTATGTGSPVRATSPDIVTPTTTKPIITHTGNDAVSAAQMKGQLHIVNGAYTPTLPTAAVGYEAWFTAQTAVAFSLDPATGTDVIYLNGAALAAGNKITSDATIRATVRVRCLIVGFYEITAEQGLFIDGGA